MSRARLLLSTLPVFGLLVAALSFDLGQRVNARLSEVGQGVWDGYALLRVAPEKPEGEKPERTTFGEEALALAAARAAMARAAGQDGEFQLLDTLAWAALANGQDAEAQQRTAEALAKAPAKEREAYQGYQRDIAAAIAEAPARLAAAEAGRVRRP